MRKGHRVEKKSIRLLAVAFLAGFALLGAFPAPANAQCVGGTILIAGNTPLAGIGMVNGTVLMGHAMSLVANSEFAAGSLIATGSILNGRAVEKNGETLPRAAS